MEKAKLSWKDLKIGDHFVWVIDGPLDGHRESECEVTEVHSDHIIAHEIEYDYNIYIDDDSTIIDISESKKYENSEEEIER